MRTQKLDFFSKDLRQSVGLQKQSILAGLWSIIQILHQNLLDKEMFLGSGVFSLRSYLEFGIII